MPKIRKISLVDQTATYLRDGIRSGRWKNKLPGVRELRAEADVSLRTLLPALKLLREEGLISGGAGRSHVIVGEVAGEKKKGPARSLRIAILIPGAFEKRDAHVQTFLVRIIMQSKLDGHEAFTVSTPSDKSPHTTGYLAKFVEEVRADVWLVDSAPVETFEWFLAKKITMLALGGRVADLPVTGATFQIEEPLRAVVRKLIALGHEKIVLIISNISRHPTPSQSLRAFFDELQRGGITPGRYNAPEWKETPGGLVTLLDSLFKVTPPTAIISWHVNVTAGVMAFLERRHLSIPGDVSLFSYTQEATLEWHHPESTLAQFRFDESKRLQFIRRWIDDFAKGRPSVKSFDIPVVVDEGTTLGRARKS